MHETMSLNTPSFVLLAPYVQHDLFVDVTGMLTYHLLLSSHQEGCCDIMIMFGIPLYGPGEQHLCTVPHNNQHLQRSHA